MIHLKNFTQYTPESDEEKNIQEKFNAIFMRAETGEDWYSQIDKFDDNSYKVKYDSNNIIVAISQDASALCPLDGSVIEMESLPQGISLDGSWEFADGVLKKRQKTIDDLIRDASMEKSNRLNYAQGKIGIWQSELQLGIINDDDKKKLIDWIGYIKKITSIDVNSAPDIEWPPTPEQA